MENKQFPQEDFELLWNTGLLVLRIDRLNSYIIERYRFERNKRHALVDKLSEKYRTVNDIELFYFDKIDKCLYPKGIYRGLYTATKMATSFKDKNIFCKLMNINPDGLNLDV